MITPNLDIESKILTKYSYYLQSLDPILNKIGIDPDLHRGGVRYQEKDKELKIPKTTMSAEMVIKRDDVRNFKVEIFCEEIYNFAQQYLESIHKMLFETMKDVTDLTGNTYNAKGAEISIDILIDNLEMVEIGFDKNGDPVLPELITGQKIFNKFKNLKWTPEQNARFTKMIEEKKKKYYAKKCYRKLSYIA